MAPLIKICGVKRLDDVLGAARAGASAVGLNFAPQSKRFIGGVEEARKLMTAATQAGARIEWAGVFVDPDFDALLKLHEALGLTILQLHGSESPNFVRCVKAAAGATQVWKAFRV